jgi:hypothetical protein
MPEVQQADPRARRLALSIVVLGTLAGAGLIIAAGAARPVLEAWVAANPRSRLSVVLWLMVLLTSAPAILMAVHLWRLGSRAVRARRFPPPGLRVVRATVVLTGEAASRRGRLLQIFAGALATSGILLGLTLWRLIAVLSSLGSR